MCAARWPCMRYGDDPEARGRLRDEAYALDVLSVLEAVLGTPNAVVIAQVSRLKRRGGRVTLRRLGRLNLTVQPSAHADDLKGQRPEGSTLE